MPAAIKNVLSNPFCYHYFRQILTLGMPFHRWVEEYGLDDPSERVADLGCGPSDILRYLKAGRCPQFYLGIDLSQVYLDAARDKARKAGIDAAFERMDLEQLPTNPAVQQRLKELLEHHRITRVLLMGVIHHIDDDSAVTTLNLVQSVPTARSLITSDVLTIPGNAVNNFYTKLDRGEFIRPEQGYDALAARSSWPRRSKFWTWPRISPVKYLHMRLEK